MMRLPLQYADNNSSLTVHLLPNNLAFKIRTNQSLYTCSYLLFIPLEIRNIIYDIIAHEILLTRTGVWHQHGGSIYDGLLLTCRQIYHEVASVVFRYRASQHNVAKICNIQTNRIVLQHARSLCLEMNHDQVPNLGAGLLATIENIQQSLQELKIRFIGKDKDGELTGLSSCGNAYHDLSASNVLTINGQHAVPILKLWRRILILRNLRVLVIRNANFPALESTLTAYKPNLEYLYIDTDPRSILHEFVMFNKRPIIQDSLLSRSSTYHAPIRVLHIGANAVFGAIQLVNKVMATLEHLTWISPCDSWQPFNSVVHTSLPERAKWHRLVDQVLRMIRFRGTWLRTLRLCSHESGFQNRFANEQIVPGYFVNTIISNLQALTTIEILEIHASNACVWAMNELILNLPPNLKRLYIADSLISPCVLFGSIQKRFWTKHEGATTFSEAEKCQELCQELSRGEFKGGLQLDTNDNGFAYININNFGSIHYSTHSLGTRRLCKDTWCTDLQRSWLTKEEDDCSSTEYLCGVVGEASYRVDCINLSRGRLGFIGYEYDTNIPEDLRLQLLKTNGRLLDREHNFHLLSQHNRPFHDAFDNSIPPLQYSPISPEWCTNHQLENRETSIHSEHIEIAAALYSLHIDLVPSTKRIQQNLEDLDACGLESDWYFGNENEASQVFAREPVASIKKMKFKSTIIDEPMDAAEVNRCHWNSPEYEVDPVGKWPKPGIPAM